MWSSHPCIPAARTVVLIGRSTIVYLLLMGVFLIVKQLQGLSVGAGFYEA